MWGCNHQENERSEQNGWIRILLRSNETNPKAENRRDSSISFGRRDICHLSPQFGIISQPWTLRPPRIQKYLSTRKGHRNSAVITELSTIAFDLEEVMSILRRGRPMKYLEVFSIEQLSGDHSGSSRIFVGKAVKCES